MSNKTQLQTNNATLDGYITRINAAKEVAAGLPEVDSDFNPLNGIAIDTGTFILDEDKSSVFTCQHNLGEIPNFVIVYVENETSANYTDYNGYIQNQILLADKYVNPTNTIFAHIYTNYGTSETLTNVTFNTTSGAYANTSLFVLNASDSFKFKAGITYRYVCGILPGM